MGIARGRIARLFLPTIAGGAVLVATSDAATSRTHPAITILSSPRVQTLQTRIVVRGDAKTRTVKPTLALGTAKFRITVTNPSSLKLVGVSVADPRSTACDRTIGALVPGASITYGCSAANVGRNYVNAATVSARWSKDARALDAAQGDMATATARTVVNVKPRVKVIVHALFPTFTG